MAETFQPKFKIPYVALAMELFGCQVCCWIAQDASKLKMLLDSHNAGLSGVGPESVGLKEFIDGNYFNGGKGCLWGGWLSGRCFLLLQEALWSFCALANAEGIQGNLSDDLLQSGEMLVVKQGGEKVLMHFIQESPGAYVPSEKIVNSLGISANVEGVKPQVRHLVLLMVETELLK
uniref:Peroxiredoxin like 2B n=1 Tax=Crocodylus porosus TaxID=8502 RepID=A0A7M4FZ88_CROPO